MPAQEEAATVILSFEGHTVKITHFGACVYSFITANGKERLYCSKLSNVNDISPLKPVRGGVPICFPCFGPAPKNNSNFEKVVQHGFVRSMRWNYLGEGSDGSAVSFGLDSTSETKALFNFDFSLIYTVSIAGGILSTKLSVTSKSSVPLEFSAALHTYIQLPEKVLPSKVTVSPLAGLNYLDKVGNGGKFIEKEEKVIINGPGGEIDRIYYKTNDKILVQFTEESKMELIKMNFNDVVVWNPGFKKAATMADMSIGDENYFMCLEPVQVGTSIILKNGENWIGEAKWNFLDEN